MAEFQPTAGMIYSTHVPPPRVFTSYGIPLHMMQQRGHHRAPCFFGEEDYNLHWLAEASKETRCSLHAGIGGALTTWKLAQLGSHRILVLEAGAAHIMGTTIMGDDPRDSVVDRWGRTHDVPNLWIVGSSVFSTSATANPQLPH